MTVADVLTLPVGTTFDVMMTQGTWEHLARVQSPLGAPGLLCFRNNCVYDYEDVIPWTMTNVAIPQDVPLELQAKAHYVEQLKIEPTEAMIRGALALATTPALDDSGSVE